MLPRGWDLQLGDFKLAGRVYPGYAHHWVTSLGGPEVAGRHVRRCYEGATTTEDFTYIDGLGVAANAVLPPPTFSELQERGLGLLAASLVTEWPTDDLVTMYPRPEVCSCAANAAKLAVELKAGRVTHPADPWFAAGTERDVARGIAATVADEVRHGKGRLPKPVRWDLLMLLQGHAHRHRPLSPEATYALAGVLGLLDTQGDGRSNAPLAGIEDRHRLLSLAAEEAHDLAEEDVDIDKWVVAPTDDSTYDRWKAHPIYAIARSAFLRDLGLDEDLQNLPDHEEDGGESQN